MNHFTGHQGLHVEGELAGGTKTLLQTYLEQQDLNVEDLSLQLTEESASISEVVKRIVKVEEPPAPVANAATKPGFFSWGKKAEPAPKPTAKPVKKTREEAVTQQGLIKQYRLNFWKADETNRDEQAPFSIVIPEKPENPRLTALFNLNVGGVLTNIENSNNQKANDLCNQILAGPVPSG